MILFWVSPKKNSHTNLKLWSMNVYKLINFLFLNDVGAHLKTHVEDLLIHTNFLPMKLGFMQELLPNQQRKKKNRQSPHFGGIGAETRSAAGRSKR